jgi:hypothetical protein
VQSALLAAVLRRALSCLVVALVTLAALPALGGDPATERQAQTLQKKALEEDSLNVNYPAAIKKLATAISRCTGDKCDATLKGALYRDLGAMLILSGSVDDGRAAFVKALGLDATLELDPSYKSPMLEGLWTDAKKRAAAGGGGVAAAPAGNEGESAPPPEGGAASPTAGDFAHVPAGAQLVRTPLPIYAEYVGTEKLLRVVVKYRGAGMTDWKPIELRKMETGYGGLIPCNDVAEGAVQYYIQGYSASDDPVASSGSRTKPYSVPIKTQLPSAGPGPSLPGQEAPKQCAESVGGSDCPPDFPGCHIQKKGVGEDCKKNGDCDSGQCASGACVEKKGEGEECEKDGDCVSGSCSDSKCTAPKKDADEACDADDDCASGSCADGKCAGGSGKKGSGPKIRRIWIGVAVGVDVMSLPQSDKACLLNGSGTGSGNTAGYECVDPTTSANFPGSGPAGKALNMRIQTGASDGDSVGGGLLLGNVRIMASFDYALGMNILLGARAGYVLSTDPASAPGPAFPPIHLEGRFTYLFGKDALASTVAPLLLLAAGASEFDANIGVEVRLDVTRTGPTRNENAWLTAGPLFGAIGGGARFLVGKNVAISTVIKAQGAFGGSAGFLWGIAPEVGAQLGF